MVDLGSGSGNDFLTVQVRLCWIGYLNLYPPKTNGWKLFYKAPRGKGNASTILGFKMLVFWWVNTMQTQESLL